MLEKYEQYCGIHTNDGKNLVLFISDTNEKYRLINKEMEYVRSRISDYEIGKLYTIGIINLKFFVVDMSNLQSEQSRPWKTEFRNKFPDTFNKIFDKVESDLAHLAKTLKGRGVKVSGKRR